MNQNEVLSQDIEWGYTNRLFIVTSAQIFWLNREN